MSAPTECQHDTAPWPSCEYCHCQSKHGSVQCQDDPNHTGEHWYAGGLDIDFAIRWDSCPHAFMPDSGMLARCDQERGHEGDHTGSSFSGIEFGIAKPEDPSNRMITQTVTIQRVQWDNTKDRHRVAVMKDDCKRMETEDP